MFLTILALVTCASASLSKTGNITLYSDTACREAVFVNSFILGLNVCGKVDNGAWSNGDIFQSYILNERPWCDSGARPYFNVYSDLECTGLIKSYEPGALYNPTGPDADGTCVVPGVPYQAMSFTCVESGDADGGASDQSSTQTATTTTSAIATISQTSLIMPSKSFPSSSITTTTASLTGPGTSQSSATQGTTSSTTSSTTDLAQTSTTSASSSTTLASGSSTTSSSSLPVSTGGANSRSVRPWMIFVGVVPVITMVFL